MLRGFDAARHPAVVAGRRSADEVYREFLDTFDVGGVVDGKVTRAEFDHYYHNVSCSIDDDDYFDEVDDEGGRGVLCSEDSAEAERRA